MYNKNEEGRNKNKYLTSFIKPFVTFILMASKGTRSQKRKRVEALFIPDVLHLHNIFQYAFDWNVMTRVSKEWKRLSMKYRDQFLLSNQQMALASNIPYHILHPRVALGEPVWIREVSKSVEWLSRVMQTKEAQKKIVRYYHKLRYDRIGMDGVDRLLQSPFPLPSLVWKDIENLADFTLGDSIIPWYSQSFYYPGALALSALLGCARGTHPGSLLDQIQDDLSWRGLALLCIYVSRGVYSLIAEVTIFNVYTALSTLFSKKFPNIRCGYDYCYECACKHMGVKKGRKINETDI